MSQPENNKASDLTDIISNKKINFQRVTTLSPKDLALQKRDESMFTSNVRRDIYDILRNPYRPNEGAPAPLSWQVPSVAVIPNLEQSFSPKVA